MPSDSITIKHNNHRILPCPEDKKSELTNLLISQNINSDIIVVCTEDTNTLKESLENKAVRVMDDKEFISSKDLTCEMLISYDVPQKAIIYMARVAKVTQNAILLVAQDEQKMLYPIETILGRVIKQDIIKGFEYSIKEIVKPIYKGKTLSKDEIKEVAKKRYLDETREKKSDGNFDKPPKKEYFSENKKEFKKDNFKKKEDKKPFEKKPFDKSGKFDKDKKKSNKFLGKDENGKALFSGKSGERNHRYDGTPKDEYAPKPVNTGRKISIKAIKEPKES